MTASEPANAHRERLVGQDVPKTEAPRDRGNLHEGTERGGHQEVARIEQEDREHDERHRRAGPKQVDHHELRGTGEHDDARRARLDDGEPGLSRRESECDADDHRRDEDRPAFDDRGAPPRHAPKGMSRGTRSAYRR